MAIGRWLAAIGAMALVACSNVPNSGMSLDLRHQAEVEARTPGSKAGVEVRILGTNRSVMAVPNWVSIKITLSNSTLLASSKVVTINQASAATANISSSTTSFTSLRPGSGYSVSAQLYDANNATGTLLKTGSALGVTLASGTNTVTITLNDPGSLTGSVGDAVPTTITIGGGTVTLSSPTGVVVDPDGNLLFADSSCRIFKKATDGTYAILAGTGTCATSVQCSDADSSTGASSCDGTGSAAKLLGPKNLSADSNGNIYFTDSGAKCMVRRSTPGGTIATMLGGGCGFSNATSYGGKFESPQGVVVNTTSGDLFIGDTGNHKIRRVAASDGQADTVAGGGADYADNSNSSQVRFSSPKGLVLSSDRTLLYVADSANNVIRKVAVSTGETTTVAGSTSGTSGFVDGDATTARFSNPSGITLGSDGNLYVADKGNHAVRKIITSTGVTSTVAGNGVAGCAEGSGTGTALLTSPDQVSRASDGSLYIANTGCNKISVVQ